MSINTLLEDVQSKSKPWCNLYVQNLTAYDTINAKEISIDSDSVYSSTIQPRYGPADGSGVVPEWGVPVDMKVVKVGPIVQLWINSRTPLATGSGSNTGNHLIYFEPGSLPEKFRPASANGDVTGVTRTIIGSTNTVSIVGAQVNGGILLGPVNGTYTDGDVIGWTDISFTYLAA